ncbi:hypothetical protein [Bacillus mycoides]|nr:hypothetical protein [Bacillus mycoides]
MEIWIHDNVIKIYNNGNIVEIMTKEQIRTIIDFLEENKEEIEEMK